jgi:hypothetical protein
MDESTHWYQLEAADYEPGQKFPPMATEDWKLRWWAGYYGQQDLLCSISVLVKCTGRIWGEIEELQEAIETGMGRNIEPGLFRSVWYGFAFRFTNPEDGEEWVEIEEPSMPSYEEAWGFLKGAAFATKFMRRRE